MSEIKVNKITPRSGTTVQVGESGDTITVPAGATFDASSGTFTLPDNAVTTAKISDNAVTNAKLQNSAITINGSAVNLGGSVTIVTGISWQATVVTGATHTASANQGIWIDTTSNANTLTLPSSPSVGDELVFSDFKRTWGTNAVTLSLNGSKYQGNTSPAPVYDTSGETVHIVYSGSTQGWIPINDGATVMETPQTYSASYLVVAGGASGGKDQGAGGGAGGYLTNVGGSAITLTGGVTYTATVGSGGAARTTNVAGDDGLNSVLSGSDISTVTSLGGGGGGCNSGAQNGRNGGSGGGGSHANGSGGSGTSPQGNDGGDGTTSGTSPSYGSGGGGGAGAVGANGSSSSGGAGGVGVQNSITGSAVYYAGGGGGYAIDSAAGAGGNGGGGAGGGSGGAATSATANTGGGGGGASGNSGAGGSGVIILSVPDAKYSGTVTGSPTVTTGVSGQTIIKFTGTGTYTA